MRGWLATAIGLGLVLSATSTRADEVERIAMLRVRLTTEPAATARCTRLGQVSDDSVKDLRRKIVRAGGDTAVLTFGVEDMSIIYAQVFTCAHPIPAPPPGPPPPPPPGQVPSPAGPLPPPPPPPPR